MSERVERWKKRVKMLLGLGAAPLVSGLGAASVVVGGLHGGTGVGGGELGLAVLPNSKPPRGPDPLILERPLNAGAPDLFAGHSSHSSHASHSSHSSHYSGGGGGTYSPPSSSPPSGYEPPATKTAPAAPGRPAGTPSPRLPEATAGPCKPSAAALFNVTTQVQLALCEKKLFSGPIDGIIGQETREALKSFQRQRNLGITGRMDKATLTALGIQMPEKAE